MDGASQAKDGHATSSFQQQKQAPSLKCQPAHCSLSTTGISSSVVGFL